MPIQCRRKIKGKASGSKGHFTSSTWHPTQNELGICSSNIKEDKRIMYHPAVGPQASKLEKKFKVYAKALG